MAVDANQFDRVRFRRTRRYLWARRYRRALVRFDGASPVRQLVIQLRFLLRGRSLRRF